MLTLAKLPLYVVMMKMVPELHSKAGQWVEVEMLPPSGAVGTQSVMCTLVLFIRTHNCTVRVPGEGGDSPYFLQSQSHSEHG